MRHYPPSDIPSLQARDNAFTVVDGKPYLVGCYGDLDNLMSIDRQLIQNQLVIETTDPHLSVIDIVIDRIGNPPIENESNYRRFLEALYRTTRRADGTMSVIRPGIEVTIEYELTSEKNGTLVRRANAVMFISNRQNYLDGSNPSITEGAILTNFIDSTVKTITDRAYGSDRLNLTFTKLTVAYLVVADRWLTRRTHPSKPVPDLNLGDLYSVGITERERYLADHGYYQPIDCCDQTSSALYRFENNGKNIWLYNGEIDDPRNGVTRVIIGSSKLNKSFIVGGGHRVEMRVSVWTADEGLVRDTTKIHQILTNGNYHHHDHVCPPDYPPHHHCHNHFDHGCGDCSAMQLLAEERRRNDLQECDIRHLNGQADTLDDLIQALAEKLDTEVSALKELITNIPSGDGTGTGWSPDLNSITLTPEGKLSLPEKVLGDDNTATKLTYNKYGIITSSTSLSSDDIPELPVEKITKLNDRLEAIENKADYILPAASELVRGGVMVPSDNHGLSVNSTGQLTLSLATQLTDGAMGHDDKLMLTTLVTKVADLERQVQELQEAKTEGT